MKGREVPISHGGEWRGRVRPHETVVGLDDGETLGQLGSEMATRG